LFFTRRKKERKKKKKMKVNGKRQSAKAHSIITTTKRNISLNVHSVESVTVLDVYYHDDDDALDVYIYTHL
jgi:ribosomal protein S9